MSTTGTRFEATPIDFTEDQLAQIEYNREGLVAAIVQDASDRAVLMFAALAHDFAKADRLWIEPLLDAVATAFPLIVEGEPDRFMTKVALLTQPVA